MLQPPPEPKVIFKIWKEKGSATMVIKTKIRKCNKRSDIPEAGSAKKESRTDSGEELIKMIK